METINLYSISVTPVDTGDGEIEFEARFNQFPDIIGVGDDENEAIKEARINLKLYFDYCQDNKIAIPTPILNSWTNDYSGKITLRMPKSLHRDLDEFAEKDGMSINAIANDAIRQYLMCKTVNEIKEEAINEVKRTGFETRSLYSDDYLPENTKRRWAAHLARGFN